MTLAATRRMLALSVSVATSAACGASASPAVSPAPAGTVAAVEDGYDLWLRYRPVSHGVRLREYRAALAQLVIAGDSPTMRAARDELAMGLRGMLGGEVALADSVSRDGALLVGTPARSPAIAALRLDTLGAL